jgi:hypothetical protein
VSESPSPLAWLDEIDFDAVWEEMLAELRAEGVDTDALIKRACENISHWQSVPRELHPQGPPEPDEV